MSVLDVPRNPLYRVLLIVAIVLGLVAAGLAGWRWQVLSGRCADGVDKVGPRDECVGITDGSYVFDSELRDVLGKIREQNDWVLEQNRDHVAIVYFEPMTLIDNDTTNYELVRHSLQGAYLSQYRANHPNGKGWEGETPLVRLLPANPGSQAVHWEHVLDQIEKRRDTDRIVAVAGLGQSLDGTRRAIDRLSELDIPMVGAIITADGFSEVEGLARVAPTNTDEVNALVTHLAGDTNRAMLVRDTNIEDTFAINLAERFEQRYPYQDPDDPGRARKLVTPIEEFESSNDPGNLFQGIAPEICFAEPDAIFFAGRFRDLKRFLQVLAERPCPDDPMRVVTGDSIVDLAGNDDIRATLQTGITLEYLHLADHNAWSTYEADKLFGSESIGIFTGDGDGHFHSVFPGESLDDGVAIMAFDAVGTAVSGVRRITDGGFDRLHGQSAVRGASGLISLGSGDPDRKLMSLLTLTALPGDTTTTVQRTLTSCTGEPFQVREEDDEDPAPCPD